MGLGRLWCVNATALCSFAAALATLWCKPAGGELPCLEEGNSLAVISATIMGMISLCVALTPWAKIVSEKPSGGKDFVLVYIIYGVLQFIYLVVWGLFLGCGIVECGGENNSTTTPSVDSENKLLKVIFSSCWGVQAVFVLNCLYAFGVPLMILATVIVLMVWGAASFVLSCCTALCSTTDPEGEPLIAIRPAVLDHLLYLALASEHPSFSHQSFECRARDKKDCPPLYTLDEDTLSGCNSSDEEVRAEENTDVSCVSPLHRSDRGHAYGV